ncbi:MAG: HEAT repeat domain-containing protein [Phycisphaerales bacterium]
MTRARFLILASLACAGCSLPPSETSFDSRDPKARSMAAIEAAASGDDRAVPGLISLLDSRDPGLRLIAAEALERITGETMGYDATAPILEREAAIDRWVDWWRTRRGHALPGELD